jgi:putative nucleotidyltransferase with HDIG domain
LFKGVKVPMHPQSVQVNSAISRSSMRQLPRVVVATSLVVGCPIVAVLALRATDVVSSTIALSLIAILLSLAASFAGDALWKRRAASGDLVFGDLMVWGWLGRWRSERLLSRTASLVGPGSGSSGDARRLSRDRRARLLERLSRTLEARDPHTHGHSRRVARHAAAIAKRMGLPRQEVLRVRTAAVLHDVGKIDTPKELIDKRGPLSAEEYEVVKQHAPVGARMVASLGDPELTALVRHHHERLDGGGYPDGLAGEQIPLGARIVAVADTFDAVTSTRPYRRAMAHKQALALLDAEAGTQLDPDVVRCFRRYYSGHWPVVFWAALLALPRQAGFLLVDQFRFGSALGAAKAAAASLATVAVGTALVSPAVPVEQGGGSSRPPALAADQKPAAVPAAAAPARARGEEKASGTGGQVADPDVVSTATPTESSSSPAATGQPGESGTSAGGERNAGSGTTPTATPAPSASSTAGSASEGTAPPSSTTTPVETAPAPETPTVVSTVNSTLEGVGATVNQVTSSPTVTGVGNIVNQVTGGLLGQR